MTVQLAAPRKLAPGDRVAVVSPSFAAPAVFPHVHELAMTRLRDELGLVPVEYLTTRQLGSPAIDRARDLMAAWADLSIRAVLATIGGDDQITVLPHLDPAVFRADPKPYVGYSDNTNLLNWLWYHGIAGYHGGSTMVHLGRGGGTDQVSVGSLRHALFSHDEVVLHEVAEFSEDEVDWTNPDNIDTPGVRLPAAPWTWHQPDVTVTGPTWGGNLEILHWTLAVSRWVRPVDDYAGCVLLLETSEEMPSAVAVSRMLRDFGERGLLAQFPAVVVGRAKASSIEHPVPYDQRAAYRADQRDAILSAFATYNPSAMLVFGVDIGHTDPQWVLPYGGLLTVDGPARRVTAHY
ncbi:LD-carboxypeptidase [Acidothermaceae bacterium B102]|nr:LD-carboxypeptidase [Acidothermaceae bacterium B102]